MKRQELIVEAVHRAARVDVSLQFPGEPSVTVHWWLDQGFPAGQVSDSLIPLALLPAMRAGLDLRIEADVSEIQLGRVEQIQRTYWSWDRSLCLIDVHAGSTRRTSKDRNRSAFFSGGVDSFYTALRHKEDLTGLVFVAGFDIDVQRQALLETAVAANRLAAEGLGLRLIYFATDLRKFSSRLLHWSEYHGAALAAAAHLCGHSRMHVPGSLSFDSTFQYGSHPELDPLYSSEVVDIAYDGFDTNRVEKTRRVAESQLALNLLRVCNSTDDLGYNCGRCEKCLRTLAALRIAGHRDALPSFPTVFDPEEVAGRRFRQARDLWRQNLRAAIVCGDQELSKAIESSLARRRGAG